MRSSARRTDKYSKKLRALVLPEQSARYTPTAADRIHLEYCVKKEAITPMLQFSYVAYLEELIKHDANKRAEEADGIYNKWLNRGLDSAILQSTAACIGVTIVPPIPCSAWETQEECEDAGCYWWDDECHSEPEPVVCDWDWKRKLTFSGNVSATNLDDFPVLVHLTNANFDFNKAKNLGEDIRFMDSDTCPSDGVPLKHEIELWDKPNSQAWVWVKVPRINGGTVNDFIYMFYGNAAAADGQDADNTWVASYVGVWHHQSDPVLLDTSGSGHNGVKNGDPTMIPGGQIGNAINYDGTGDYYDCGDPPDFDFGESVDFTVESWIKVVLSPGGPIGVLAKRLTATSDGWFLYVSDTTGQLTLGFRPTAGANIDLNSIAFDARDNTWHHIVGTADRDGLARLYIDGNLNNSIDMSGVGNIQQAVSFKIGRAFTANGYREEMWGDIDEVRLERNLRTTDWVKAQFKSMDETLITYGAEEVAG